MTVNKGMKFKSTTIFLLCAAIACGVGVYWWTTSQDRPEEMTEQQELVKKLFQFNEDQVATLIVETPKLALVFERSQQSFPHTWRMKKPQDQPADEAAIAFLLNLLATTKSPRTLSVETSRQKEFGFDQSPGRIKVILENNQTHHLTLGGQDPTESYLYAQVDPRTDSSQTLQVVLVPTAFLNAINRPLAEWQVNPEPTPPSAPATPSVDPGPSIPLPPPQVPQ
ncbi:DUF4340 domain-containing protein [Acaryochloris sp. IP29b_bin.137]|uniref:DUF4340 domain-containing protein n=1 Tax=Acaryochloris sp. IP29b_bin.137 TaxID=2969217 RepID=UPI0026125779|nr:DUF4340 domain-containing protein [Acaryochloris sp. IP29b_bin.137]